MRSGQYDGSSNDNFSDNSLSFTPSSSSSRRKGNDVGFVSHSNPSISNDSTFSPSRKNSRSFGSLKRKNRSSDLRNNDNDEGFSSPQTPSKALGSRHSPSSFTDDSDSANNSDSDKSGFVSRSLRAVGRGTVSVASGTGSLAYAGVKNTGRLAGNAAGGTVKLAGQGIRGAGRMAGNGISGAAGMAYDGSAYVGEKGVDGIKVGYGGIKTMGGHAGDATVAVAKAPFQATRGIYRSITNRDENGNKRGKDGDKEDKDSEGEQ